MKANLLMFLMVLFLLPASLTRADEVNGNVSASASRSTFQLIANPAFEACLSGSKAATATVTVVKGKLNDTLTIKFAMQNRNWRLIYSLFRTLRFSRMGAPTHFLETLASPGISPILKQIDSEMRLQRSILSWSIKYLASMPERDWRRLIPSRSAFGSMIPQMLLTATLRALLLLSMESTMRVRLR